MLGYFGCCDCLIVGVCFGSFVCALIWLFCLLLLVMLDLFWSFNCVFVFTFVWVCGIVVLWLFARLVFVLVVCLMVWCLWFVFLWFGWFDGWFCCFVCLGHRYLPITLLGECGCSLFGFDVSLVFL